MTTAIARRSGERVDKYDLICDMLSNEKLVPVDGVNFEWVSVGYSAYTRITNQKFSVVFSFRVLRDGNVLLTVAAHGKWKKVPSKCVGYIEADHKSTNAFFDLLLKIKSAIASCNDSQVKRATKYVLSLSGSEVSDTLKSGYELLRILSDKTATAIARDHGLVLVARVSFEAKTVDLSKLLKRKKPFTIGKFEFDKRGTWKNHGEPNDDYRYGVTVDGWGDYEKPCIALFDRSQYDATTPAIDVYSVDLNSVEPSQRVIDELTSITERAKKMNKRKPRS